MALSKSLHEADDASEQPQTIVSTFVASDTGRRRFSVRGMTSKASSSRRNRECQVCGQALPSASRGVMCRACYQRVRKQTVACVCANCGVAFERPLYVHEHALRLGCTDAYCSKACSRAHHAVKHAKICAHCRQPMPGQRNRLYCSPACRAAVRPVKLIGCRFCGLMFTPRSHRTQFCSQVCANAAHSERMRGAGNSHFKTGTSYAKWFAEMRSLILERDKHRCIACQCAEQTSEVLWLGQMVTRSNLVIHHINEQPTDNTPDNLVTLCKTCHAVHHKSKTTPWPWFATYAQEASRSMTSKWKAVTTSLQTVYSSITVIS